MSDSAQIRDDSLQLVPAGWSEPGTKEIIVLEAAHALYDHQKYDFWIKKILR